MNRLLKWLLAIGCTATIVLAASRLVLLVVAPPLVERGLVRMLNRSGFDRASMQVASLSLHGAVIEKLDLGPDRQLRADSLVIRYSPSSLLRGSIARADIYGLRTEMSIHEGRFDWPLLANASGSTGKNPLSMLLLDKVRLHAATVQMHIDSQEVPATIDGTLRKTGVTRLDLGLEARLEQANVAVTGTYDLLSRSAECALAIDSFPVALLQAMGVRRFEDPSLATNIRGRMDADVTLNTHKKGWLLKGTVGGKSVSLKLRSSALDASITVDSLRFSLSSQPSDTNRVSLSGSVRGSGRAGRFALRSSGPLRMDLEATGPAEGMQARLALSGDGLGIRGRDRKKDLSIRPDTLWSDVHIRRTDNRYRIHRWLLRGGRIRVSSSSMGLHATNVSFSYPVLPEGRNDTHGRFRIGWMRYKKRVLPTIRGTITPGTKRIAIAARAKPLPEATARITGWIDWRHATVQAALTASVPEFRLRSCRQLAKWFPALKKDSLAGLISARTHYRWARGTLAENRTRIAIKQGSWTRPASETNIEGISGVLNLGSNGNAAAVPVSELSFSNARAGAFTATEGAVRLRSGGSFKPVLEAIRCRWADGTLVSDSIHIDRENATLHLTMRADSLKLQSIMEFFDYRDVQADGLIHGHLPITLQWKKQRQLSFGEGVLEARPSNGSLQFTRKAAMSLLGIKKPTKRHDSFSQEKVTHLAMEALQDLRYTRLRAAFEEEPGEGWVARVDVAGYGPQEARREQRIPIGGLEIAVHNLGRLINTLVFGKVSGGRVRVL